MSALMRKPSPNAMGIPRGNPGAMGAMGNALAQAVPGMTHYAPQPGPPPPQVVPGGMPGTGPMQGIGASLGAIANGGPMPGYAGGPPAPMPGNIDPGYYAGSPNMHDLPNAQQMPPMSQIGQAVSSMPIPQTNIQVNKAPIRNGMQRVSPGMYQDASGRIVRR
jgi:hypothetical protein